MGKGKGSPEFWAARVKPGRILFELDGVPGSVAAGAFERAAMKLPVKTKVVARLGDTSHLGGKKGAKLKIFARRPTDRKSDVKGKGVLVRVGSGGRRRIKHKNKEVI